MVASAPAFGAAGPNGQAPGLEGTVFDLKPTFAVLLTAAGLFVAAASLLAARFAWPVAAITAAAVALVAGFSLDQVTYEIHNDVIDRVWTVFELRGRGPWQAALGALIALVASLALAWSVSGASAADRGLGQGNWPTS